MLPVQTRHSANAMTKNSYRPLALTILILAFALRVWALDARSLWFDEAHEYWAATTDLAHLPTTVQIVLNDPPLYTFLLHFWLHIGDDVFTQRYLSVLISILGVAGSMLIGLRMANRQTALISALLVAVMSSQIRYAQDAGQYVVMSSLLTYNILALMSLIQSDKWSRYLWWIVTAWAVSYTYYGAIFPIVVAAAATFLGWLNEKNLLRIRKSLLAAGIYGLGIMPLVLYFLPRQMFRGPTANAFVIQSRPFLQQVETALTSTADLMAFQWTGWPWTVVPLWLTSLLAWPLLGLALHPRTARPGKQIATWLLCTWGAYYLLGYIQIYPYTYRYGMILTPLIVPLLAQGIENLRILPQSRWAMGLWGAVLVAICLVSLPNYPVRNMISSQQNWPWPETSQIETVTESWMRYREGKTATYVYYGAIPTFRYYLNAFGYEAESPPATWIQDCGRKDQLRPEFCEGESIYYSSWNRHLPIEDKTQNILDYVAGKGERFWLVFAHIYPNEQVQLLESLSATYVVIQEYKDTGAEIYLLQRLP